MFKLGGGSVWTLWNWVCGRNLFLQDTLSQTHTCTCELTPRYQQPTWNNQVATKLEVPTTNLEQPSSYYLLNSIKQTNFDSPNSYLPITTNWSTVNYQMQHKKTMVAKRKKSNKLSNYLNWGGKGYSIWKPFYSKLVCTINEIGLLLFVPGSVTVKGCPLQFVSSILDRKQLLLSNSFLRACASWH